MGRASRLAIMPVACGWSDIGSWDALAKIGTSDMQGNTVSGDVTALYSHNTDSHEGIPVSGTPERTSTHRSALLMLAQTAPTDEAQLTA